MSKQFIDWKYDEWNKAHKIEVGQTFYNKDGETFVIVRRLNPLEISGISKSNKNSYYEVCFIITGNKQIAHHGKYAICNKYGVEDLKAWVQIENIVDFLIETDEQLAPLLIKWMKLPVRDM